MPQKEAQFIDLFLYGSSEIDWCEKNFEVTDLVAEFWNTVSNVLFLVIPLTLMFINSAHRKHLPIGLNILLGLLVIIGIGSIYFHGMLSFVGQLLDEIGIIWVCMCGITFYLPKEIVRQYFRQSRPSFMKRMLVLMLVLTVLSFYYPTINHVLLFVFTVPCVTIVCYEHRRGTERRAILLGRSCLLFFFVALFCWVLDRTFCDFWLGLSFPYFHAFWHLFISLSAYQVVILLVYYDAKRELPDLLPVIKYWPDDSQKLFGVYYMGFAYRAASPEQMA